MAISTDPEKIERLLTRGVENWYPSRDVVKKRLKSGKRMRIYVGIDPTAPHLHIGHAIQLRKLREFQDLGHEVIWLMGTFTAMIGDPTDKSAVRTQLTKKEVRKNLKTYKKQASRFLRFSGPNAVKVKANHKWLGKMSFSDVVQLSSHFTVQQMSERDMFEKRLKEGKPVYLHEFLYPLMQGYDMVAMGADLQFGGSDQTFNLLAGRTLMKAMKGEEGLVMTLKLLTNDQGKKMSKSEGGFIALDDTPEDVYGKLMAMDDSMIFPYFELATDVEEAEIDALRKEIDGGKNPRDVKMQLARTVTTIVHGKEAALKAEKHFKAVFQKGTVPEEMKEVTLGEAKNIVDVLVESGLTSSKSEARRLISQKAIKVDDTPVTDAATMLEGTAKGVVLQRGKRHFVKLVRS